MDDYVYQEYPKCLYQPSGETVTVANQEEDTLCVGDGYLTAAQFHAQEPTVHQEQEAALEAVLDTELEAVQETVLKLKRKKATL